jgi:hypothetical protein
MQGEKKMMKQKPTMKQRLWIVGNLSVIIREIQDDTFDVDSIAIVKAFVEKYDCSGHFFTECGILELLDDIAHKPSNQAIYSAALLIFIFSDAK